MSFSRILQEGLPFVLPYLQLALPTGVKQVVNGLVVYLNVLALHFELYLIDPLILKHGLVVKSLLAGRGHLLRPR